MVLQKRIILLGIILFFGPTLSGMEYQFTTEPIDVVIPCVEKDAVTLDLAIAGIKENGDNIRNVFVVSSKNLSPHATWIDEKVFPFTKKDVSLVLFNNDEKKANEYLNHKKSRIGWMFQQLLKLYAPLIIPDISSNVLILDADTIFLNPVQFQTSTGAALFNPGTEHTSEYFEHAKKVIPGFKKVFPTHSGISHHMLFQRVVLDDLFQQLRNVHDVEPWIALVRNINHKHIFAGISEYEIYFNFVFSRTNLVQIRTLKWTNDSNLIPMQEYKKQGYHYVSYHDYARGKRAFKFS